MERLDDASVSFFVFLSQEDIFMGSSCGGSCSGACGSDASAHQLIKPWAATARAGPCAFSINAGAEAQTSSRQSAARA
jgi:hypothetical protein